MKKEWKPLMVCGLISVLAIGLMTSFKYDDVEIQMHKSNFIIDAVRACIYLTAIIFTFRNLYIVIDMMTDRYKILAVFVAIINPLAALFVIIFIYFNVVLVAKHLDAGDRFVTSMVLMVLLVVLIVAQISIEVRILRKLRKFIA